jgi:hypothetical protein
MKMSNSNLICKEKHGNMQRSKIIWLFGILFVIVVGNQVAFSQAVNNSPQTILKKMAAVYANASSYQDSGVVIDNIKNNGSAEPFSTFKTYFSRPQKYRFEWIDQQFGNGVKYKNAVWNDGQNTYSSYGWESSELAQSQNLNLGIAGATGVSRGAAHTVSALLMSEIDGFRLTQITKPSLLRQENFEGVDCFVIHGEWHRSPVDLWIGTNDFLLRKIRSRNSDSTYKEEIRRNIKLNKEILTESFTSSQLSITER